jgi:hypothetical protein
VERYFLERRDLERRDLGGRGIDVGEGTEVGETKVGVGERIGVEETEVGERESRFVVSSVVSSLPWVLCSVATMVEVGGDGEEGEAGETSITPLPINVAEPEIDKPEPNPTVIENGSLKLKPSPLISFLSSSPPALTESLTPPLLSLTLAASPSSPIQCDRGLDFTTPLFLLPGNGEHSFLAEETKVGKGIWLGDGDGECESDGNGEQCFPGGAIQFGLGGEGGFGVAEEFLD